MTTRNLLVLVAATAILIYGMVHYTYLVDGEREAFGLNQPAAEELRPSASEPTAPATLDGVTFTPMQRLPLPGSAPSDRVYHTIPLEEIKRGCFRQDCIPSVDAPEFVPASSLADTLLPESLGIILPEAGRFYPFPMLETREIVNDVLPDGRPVAVTYCPLCGTGIVFSRELEGGRVTEFGVSGMLWQSNLLMYDRAAELSDRNLWSQVLGQAVVGNRSGELLDVVPSDVITFSEWLSSNPDGDTLTTGAPRDPYDGDYYGTAQFFEPNFDPATSSLESMARVHGIIVNGQPKAYLSEALFADLSDIVAGERVIVQQDGTSISFVLPNGEVGQAPTVIPDIEGFWFSWVAAHPTTELWVGEEGQ